MSPPLGTYSTRKRDSRRGHPGNSDVLGHQADLQLRLPGIQCVLYFTEEEMRQVLEVTLRGSVQELDTC